MAARPKCDMCPKDFANAANLCRHKRTNHNPKKICQICHKPIPNRSDNIENHMKTHVRKHENTNAPQGTRNASSEHLLTYPQKGKKSVIMNTQNYLTLADGEWLDDVVILFYLEYLFNEKLTDVQRDRTCMFDTYFYPYLTNMNLNGKKGDKSKPGKSKPTTEQRYKVVRNWAKGVDLFSKDFIVVPIHINKNHWMLAIICFPKMALTKKRMTRSRNSSRKEGSTVYNGDDSGSGTAEPIKS